METQSLWIACDIESHRPKGLFGSLLPHFPLLPGAPRLRIILNLDFLYNLQRVQVPIDLGLRGWKL
jgi:hypothetical protein